MKRSAIFLSGALLVGCGSSNSTPSSVSDTSTPPPSQSTAIPPPTVAAPAAKPITPFELTQDGKTYIFADFESLTAFQNGKQQPFKMEKPDLTPGTQVVIEAADQAQADQLIAGYAKAHPAPAK